MKEQFIKELAAYLTSDVALRSIGLQMGKPDAEQWARLINLTPLNGYATPEEAEKVLMDFLG